MKRRSLLAAAAVLPLGIPPAKRAPNTDVHVFYYSWYGRTGGWRHWPQGGHNPPLDIGANLYPTLGPYDSGDAGVIDQHMRWLVRAGVGVLVFSWWGQGSYEDNLAPPVLAAAARHGLRVAWHHEPYGGRTAQSTVDDIRYIHARYGGSPAFHNAFYVFESLRITDWSVLEQVRGTSIVLAQTTDTSKVAGFGGMYTYDAIAGNTAPGWAGASAYCRANGLVWAPSIGPGYIDDRAVPGNTTPTLGREDGATYDRQWNNAINSTPTWVSITSFNEWHEGSVIEPASGAPPAGFGYETYGGLGETYYLDRTRYWAERWMSRRQLSA